MCDACTATVNEIEAFMAMDELVKLMEDVSKIACSFLPIEHLTDTVRIFVCQRTIFQAYLVGLSGALTNSLA